MANCDFTRTLNHETIIRIREALLIGLAAFGELERLSSVQEIQAMRGRPVRGQRRVIYPTGAPDTVCRFADTLRALD